MASSISSRKVKVVGKIRCFSESESCGRDSKHWITVTKPQEDDLSINKVIVSFSDQSSNSSKKDSSYELNDCYQQDEDTAVLFTKEIKPLISEVFNGGDASIIAYGARGSGKTASIQGRTDKPGLSVMAMDEILTKARDIGKCVLLSIYEVFQEHAYDLLDSKRSEIQVLEDARGRIKLKGLSQVSVESLSQFEDYLSRSSSGKTGQKIPVEVPKRSHKVVVVHLSSMSEPSSINRGGKMNFVDLAGYVDTRRKSSEGNNQLENVKINKSLHATMNVIYALKTNDSRVPFRESKLTRMLQESLGGSSPILLLACMNPLFCQDTIHTVSVASRSCQSNNRVSADLAKKATGSSSTRVQALPSQNIVKPLSTSKAVRKQVDCKVRVSTKMASIKSSGRKFKEAKEIIGSQAECLKTDDGSATIDNSQESTTTTVTISQSQEDSGNDSLTNSRFDSVSQEDSIVEHEGENHSFCQNTIHTVTSTSRSFQSNNRVQTDSTKKANSSTRASSQKIVRPLGTPKSVRNQVDCNVQLSSKMASIKSSGRKHKEAKEIIGNQTECPKTDDGSVSIDNSQESTTTVTISQLEDLGNDSLTNICLDSVSDEVCQQNTIVEHEGQNPSLCQNTIHTVTTTSQSFQSNNLVQTDSTKKANTVTTTSQSFQSNNCVQTDSTKKANTVTATSQSFQSNNCVQTDSTKKANTVTTTSQSFQSNNRVQTDSTKKANSSIRVSSQKIVRPFGTPNVVKKLVDCNVSSSTTKKATIMSSGRKLKEAKEIICSQAKSPKRDDGTVKMVHNLPEIITAVPALQPEEYPGNNLLKDSHLDSVSHEVLQHNSVVEHEKEVFQQNSTVEDKGEVIHKDNLNNNLDDTPAVTNEKSAVDHGTTNKDLLHVGGGSPPLSERLKELSTSLKLFCSTTPARHRLLQDTIPIGLTEITEPKTPDAENRSVNAKICSPWDAFSNKSSRMKDSLIQDSLKFLNSASKDELKKLKGIGEKRATYIMELREESPEPFQKLEDLTEIGLSAKQIKGIMKDVAGGLFS